MYGEQFFYETPSPPPPSSSADPNNNNNNTNDDFSPSYSSITGSSGRKRRDALDRVSSASMAIRRQVWDARVPLVLRGGSNYQRFSQKISGSNVSQTRTRKQGAESDDSEEDIDSDDSNPCLAAVMARRCSYLPMYLKRLIPGELETGVEREWRVLFTDGSGRPLPWHIPVGVLYDLCGYSIPLTVWCHFIRKQCPASFPPSSILATLTASASTEENDDTSEDFSFKGLLHSLDESLPSWPFANGSSRDTSNANYNVAALFSISLDGLLNTTSSTSELSSSYHSALKQADWLRWHSSRRIGGLPRTEQQLLWDCVSAGSGMSRWWRINTQLIAPVDRRSDCLWADYCMRLSNGNASQDASFEYFTEQFGRDFGRVPLRVYTAASPNSATAADPFLFGHSRLLSLPSTIPRSADSDWDLLRISDLLSLLPRTTASNSPSSSGFRVAVCQGIAVPRETPLLWLAHHLTHPDNFIHLILK